MDRFSSDTTTIITKYFIFMFRFNECNNEEVNLKAVASSKTN